MSRQPFEKQLEEKLWRYAIILSLANKEKERFNSIYPEESEELDLLGKELKLILIESPGLIVDIDIDPKLVKLLIKIIWNSDDGEIDMDVYIGDNSDFGQNMVQGYMDRIRLLRPIVVSYNPEYLNFRVHLREAVLCFAHGLDTSCLIMTASVLEAALRERLQRIDTSLLVRLNSKKDPSGVYWNTLTPLIHLAFEEEIINNPNRKNALDIADLRNKAIHESRDITEEESMHAMKECIRIVEHLYKKE